MAYTLNKEDRHAALRIVCIYALVAAVWIFISDNALRLITSDAAFLVHLEILKGFFFIFMTAILLYQLISQQIKRSGEMEKGLRIGQKIINATTDAMYVKDVNGRYQLFNSAASQVTGKTAEEMIGSDDTILFSAEDARRIMKQDRQIMDSGRVNTYEEYLKMPDGTNKIFITTKGPIFDENGEVGGLFGVSRDVTERKELQTMLLESEERFRTAFAQAAVGQAMTDTEGNFLQVNKAYCDITGYTEEELHSMSIESITHPEDFPACMEHIRELLSGKTNSFIIEKRYVTKSGKPVWIRNSTAAVRNGLGNISNLIALSEDITEQKKAEVCLSESEEKYRSIFEEIKDVIFISTPEGKFIDVNPVGLQWLGYSSLEELQRIDIPNDLYLNAQDRIVFQEAIERQGYVKDFEVQLKKANGQQITVGITATAVRDEKGRVVNYRGVMRDVTLEKTLEHQIMQAQKMEAVGQLAGGIAHDFNNILSAITGYGHLVLMQIQEDSLLRPYVEQILESSERAAMLTQNLLTFSRKQIITPHPARINEIIRNVAPVLTKLTREDIELKLELNIEDSTVEVDRLQIEQVLMNLVTNARDAMPNGGILTIGTQKMHMDTTFIEAHGYGKIGNYAVISVEDTGAGLDEKTKTRIFEPFFTTKELGKGTGLGLAMAYGVVKQNNGFINVYSEVGKGTTFRIYLPEVTSTVEQRADEKIQSPLGGTETILLVEDDQALRKLAVTLLDKYGYSVIDAIDGDDALARFKEHKESIDLLITDVVIPKRSGIEVFEEIRKFNPEMKVLFLSGYAKDITQNKGILDTNVNFLQKPISPNTLLKKIRDILDH
jgi:two-component system, cell cycle sensor histidine kinase and response regulator CckA